VKPPSPDNLSARDTFQNFGSTAYPDIATDVDWLGNRVTVTNDSVAIILPYFNFP
jgi:hypothetical protein